MVIMSPLALWLCIILLIEAVTASDVPFVFDETTADVAGYSSAQLEQAKVSSPDLAGVPAVTQVADNEVLDFPITGGGNLPNGSTEKKVSDLKAEFDARVEPENSRVNKEAIVLALKYPGDLTIDQIAAIYGYLKNGDESKNGWGYVRDPRGIDYLRYANETLEICDEANCVGGGDCDDFSILMAALVESVGGTTRVILARNNTTGGHAYTEVYLGRIDDPNNQVENIISWLKGKFNTDKIYTHIDTDTKDVWLNLDWGPDEEGNAHPGGPFFQGDKHIVLCIRDKFVKTPLDLPEEAKFKTWKKTFGGSDYDTSSLVQQTIDGGYIFVGLTESYGAGSYDAWLLKTDANGNKLWDRTFGGSEDEVGASVQQTSDGGYIITGYTESFGDGKKDVLLIKTDANGNKLWDRTFGGSEDDCSASVQQTSDGGYIITGVTESFGDGNMDAWLIKTDSSGNKEWDKTFGGLNNDFGNFIQQTSDEGYIIAGATFSQNTAGNLDAWLIKTDSSGNKEWDNTFALTHYNEANSVRQTNDGGYIIDCYAHDDIGVISEVWLIKTSSSGNKMWDKTFNINYTISTGIGSVQQTNDGGYILAGCCSLINNNTCAWLTKTDSSGNIDWNRIIIGQEDEGWAESIQQTRDGGYIIAGQTASHGWKDGMDVWLIKTDADGNI
jgi:hypothetical protein